MNKYLIALALILAIVGVADASYLTYEHFSGRIPPCGYSQFQWIDCGTVLKSKYAVIVGVPLAMFGAVHYVLLTGWILLTATTMWKYPRMFAVMQAKLGFLYSLYLVFIQLVILKAICLYCMVSALVSTLLFITIVFGWARARKETTIWLMSLGYKLVLKPLFFKVDPELVHNRMTENGEIIGKFGILKRLFAFMLKLKLSSLEQKVKNVEFKYPIGLSAGFDYEAKLTQTLAPLGFGFQTVGTITNSEYEGNEKPRLGRLPKSKSLLVNKGFKNPGADAIIRKLENKKFEIPVGISIGKTNSKSLNTQEESIEDIVQAFGKFEKSKVKLQYYELNISCPNLHGSVEFYSVKNLKQLLTAIDKLKLTKPLFVKMPIDKSEKETLEMLKEISLHKVTGVIFGNLQKDRTNSSFDKNEIESVKNLKGNFSGKPTYDQSNNLIKLAYKNYRKQLVIIGCGGVFSAENAYEKIKNGATLVQMITGMIFRGPQTIMEINLGLDELMRKDGYTHISQVIGKNVK